MRNVVKVFCTCIFSLFLFFTPVVAAQAAEQVTQFTSELELLPDTSLRITETIQYTTDQSRHGIYRYIPLRYTRGGANETVRITGISVTDGLGQPVPYERTRTAENLTLKIGDPESTFIGAKTYVVAYEVENAVRLVPESAGAGPLVPELYWDITGEGWQVDIASTTARLISPAAAVQETRCFAGPFGTAQEACSISSIREQEVVFTYPERISYGDTMTIVARLDSQGSLVFPTAQARFLKRLLDNSAFLPLLIPGVVMGVWWWLKGRDAEFLSWNVFIQDTDRPTGKAPLFSRRQAPFVYEPLKDITPGQVGALLNEKVDIHDVVAEIADLARQKYIRIEREEEKRLILGPKVEYIFHDLQKDASELPEHQQYLLKHIFAKAKGKSVKMSDLKGTFYTHFEKIKSLILESLTERALFEKNPSTVHGIAFTVATVLSVLTGVWLFQLLSWGLIFALPVFGVSVIAAFLFAYWMPAKTAQGRNYMWQVKGLQRMIKYGAWRQKINEKHLFFEEVLPFAIALGVVDKLSRDMEDLQVGAPEYVPGGAMHAFSTAHFVNAFTTDVGSSMAYNPNSSSAGSGSGFSGGFSGGGGGGGGGGSW